MTSANLLGRPMNRKYRLVPSVYGGLYQIQAVRDFKNCRAGEYGGFVSGEHNLSHDGDCWVFGNGRVYDNALVTDNAVIDGNARVYGNAVVAGNVYVGGTAHVCGNENLDGTVRVYDGVYEGQSIRSERGDFLSKYASLP